VLRVITGASGGGVNAAIAARALNFDFPHIVQGMAVDPNGSGNPFYDTWIRDLTLDHFLATSDIESELISILNGRAIDEGAAKIVAFAGPPKPRPWIAAPLRLIMTLTNLAGVPYRLDLSGAAKPSSIMPTTCGLPSIIQGSRRRNSGRTNSFSILAREAPMRSIGAGSVNLPKPPPHSPPGFRRAS
jgi:hypothetical protein